MKKQLPAPRIYRTATWIKIVVLGAALLSPAAALSLWFKDEHTLLSLGGFGLALLALLGALDAFTTRVPLSEESIEIVANFRTRGFQRAAFSSVSWAKGCPISLHLVDGGKVELPGGLHGPEMQNTLRAWLARGFNKVPEGKT
jgi:hypothetical protein